MANLKRAVVGFLLSFVFLIAFGYMIAGVNFMYGNLSIIFNNSEFLGSVLNGVDVVLSSDNISLTDNNSESQLPLKNELAKELNIQAQSAISVFTNLSGTDKVLFDKNIQRKLSIASISKLMTALVALENIDFSKEITISSAAANQSTDFELLKEGEVFFPKDLLYAMLIGSDNAAGYAFAESIGTNRFIELMNRKAMELNLSDTSFANPTGLDSGNFSTVQDLASLAKYFLKNHQDIIAITSIPEYNLYTTNRMVLHKIINTNKLLKDKVNLGLRIIGGKTGVTRMAGECLLVVVKSPDNNGYLVNVILESNDRFGEMKKIINWVDGAYQW